MARIRDEIARDGPMTFARFMDLALYDPDGGYYRAAAARPGREGDFLTAPEAHPIFGARCRAPSPTRGTGSGGPDPFVVREHGAGTGALALAILDGLARERPDLGGDRRYEPVEVDPRRLAALAARLGRGRPRRGWCAAGDARTPGRRASSSPTRSSTRCRRIASSSGTASCARSASASTRRRFVDVEAEPSTPALAARLAAEGVALADGQRAEICLAVEPGSRAAAAGLGRGVLLLIDYGYPAAELYDPVRRATGTLRAYLRHRVHDDPYRPRRPPGPDRPRGRDRRRARRARPPGSTISARRPRPSSSSGSATEDLPARDPGRPGDDDGGLLDGPLGGHPAARPGGDGPLPGHGLRAGWPAGPPLAGLAFRGPR